jgi:hypothetical protein
MIRYVWVVEMYNRGKRRWEPCAAARLCREEARSHMRYQWQDQCPDDRFRVFRYSAANRGAEHGK